MHVLFEIMLGLDPVEIVHDRGTVGNRLLLGPRFEFETQCVHVAVAADAGILEQVPGPADIIAALDHGKALAGTFVPQMNRHADSRNPGADDQYVDRYCRGGTLVRNLCSHCRLSQLLNGYAIGRDELQLTI